jgi:hypothetical protein
MVAVAEKTVEDQEELAQALGNAEPALPLNPEQIEQLARRAGILRALRGQTVIEQGAPAKELYFVISGQLRALDTSDGQVRMLNYHAPNTFVGERGLLLNQPRAARVEAVSDAKLAFWNQADFNWLLSSNDGVRPYFEGLARERDQRAGHRFPGKQWDEVTIIVKHKHPLMLISALIGPTFLLLFGLGLLITWLIIGQGTSSWIGLAISLPIIAALLWGVYNYIDWRDDEYIVTTKRLIHIERYPLYGEEWDEAPLIRIQDVVLRARNLWQRLLNYYDLTIKTAGAGEIVFEGIRDAEQVMEAIFKEKARAQERREAADVASIRRALAQRMNQQIPDVELPVDTLVPTTGAFEPGQRHLPRLLDYLWPRMAVVEGDTITWRKHWFVWLTKTMPGLLSFIVLSALTVLALLRVPPFGGLGEGTWVLGLFLGFATFLAFFWYIYLYDDWHKDIFIVTSDRIVDVDSSSFRLRGEERREGTFDVIQNTTYSIPDFFHKLLNMGDVFIQTAAVAGNFTFEKVYDPSAVQQEIFNRMVAYQENQRLQERIRDDVRSAEWFNQYHRLHVQEDHPTG